jgi:class 3 adenylate cyclase
MSALERRLSAWYAEAHGPHRHLRALPEEPAQKRRAARTRVSAEPGSRRLAAILAADVVGYSRMVADDETGTLGRLRALRA